MKDLILKGPPADSPRIEKGIGEYFFEKAELYGNKIFQINGENGYTETFLVTKQRSTRVAINLQRMGIKPKDVVLICCRNNPNNIIPALASFYLGAYVASVDPMQSVADIKHALALVEPRFIFVEDNSLPLIEKALEDSHLKTEIIVIENSETYVNMSNMEKETDADDSFKPIKQKGSDIAGIVFSSGTTSAPKGILLSNSFVLNSAQGLVQHKNFMPGVILHFASLYWVSTWFMIGTSLTTGSAKLMVPAISGEKFLQLVDQYKVTYILTSVAITYAVTNLPEEVIKKYDTSSLYHISVGGSTVEQQQIQKVRKALPHTYVSLAYGSTEGNCMICHGFSNLKAYQEKVLSSGTVVPELQLKIVDVETEKVLGPNQQGEVRIKSPFLMSGYYKFEKSDVYDEDGFFKTGDVGYYDDDEYVYITDRIGDTFKYKLNHISPSIIEHTLLKHPAVAAAVVFGVPHTYDRNHPGACVVLKQDAKVTTQELLDFVNSNVSDPQQLRAGLVILDSFPETPSGKIQRRAIRDLFIKANNKN